jgi:ABC-type lipoprotein export system ATPase subunit
VEHVSLENVSKTYRLNGRDVVALKDFSFRFQAGESYLLSGPSGSGKTTLLSLLGGLDYPSSGKIFYDDLEISGLSLPQLGELRRQKLAFIFQDYVLFDELTVPASSIVMMCGPEVMMRLAAHSLREKGIADDSIYLSMERRMECAVGLCGHCQYREHFVCKDGPVFSYQTVKDLLRTSGV